MNVNLRQDDFNAERQLYNFSVVLPSGKKVGMAQLRLKPSKSEEMPEGFESHVYFEIDKEYRNHGYGTDALDDLLKIASKHGLNPLVATVNSDNAPSIHVLEKCGGKLADQAKTASGQEVLKYLIPTKS